jgi:dephospho-CoA kinase
MAVIGLSGGIASGKSTVARMLADLGAGVIDADAIGHALLEAGGAAADAAAARFGPAVVAPDGSIDRAKLGAIVFSDAAARRDLEAISHPRIYAEMCRRLDAFAREPPPGRVVVVDAPLLVETGGRHLLGLRALVVVAARPEDQIDRAVARGTPRQRAVAVLAAQAPQQARLAAADYVIDNRGSLSELQAGVRTLWADLAERFGAVPAPAGQP